MDKTGAKYDKFTGKSTQADQHNPNMKIKFFTNEDSRLPLHRNLCDYTQSNQIYNADGSKSQFTQSNRMHFTESEFTQNEVPKVIDDDEFDDDFNSTFFGDNISRGNTNNDASSGKSRYIHAPYTPSGSKSTGGFGNDLDRFSENKFGMSTRGNNKSLSDMEIDRFHFTYRSYQNSHLGSFPEPENTRLTNKKTLNNNY